jgi:hypothetical protein
MANSGHFDSGQHKVEPSGSQPLDGFFNPITLALMSSVLEAAWTAAQEFYGASASDRSEVRVFMVERIIEAIEAGVVDEEGLLRAALSYKQGDTD